MPLATLMVETKAVYSTSIMQYENILLTCVHNSNIHRDLDNKMRDKQPLK